MKKYINLQTRQWLCTSKLSVSNFEDHKHKSRTLHSNALHADNRKNQKTEDLLPNRNPPEVNSSRTTHTADSNLN